LQEALANQKFLLPYDANRPLEQSIAPTGFAVLAGISAGYVTILSEVRSQYPNVTILCYSYDYPKPTARQKKYIGQHLRTAGYPLKTWPVLVKAILDQMAATIMTSVAQCPGVVFFDCFGVSQRSVSVAWRQRQYAGNLRDVDQATRRARVLGD
jgi:hypothetical protein